MGQREKTKYENQLREGYKANRKRFNNILKQVPTAILADSIKKKVISVKEDAVARQIHNRVYCMAVNDLTTPKLFKMMRQEKIDKMLKENQQQLKQQARYENRGSGRNENEATLSTES